MKKMMMIFAMLFATQGFAQQECMMGEVKMFAGNYAPRFWALAQGQILPIAQNTALFSIMGTTYGGDGRTTFALPDLRGRVPVGTGQGVGLRPVFEGQRMGVERTQLNPMNLPSLSGVAPAKRLVDTGETLEASAKVRGNGEIVEIPVYEEVDVVIPFQLNSAAESFENRQPSMGMNYIICIYGLFPSRS